MTKNFETAVLGGDNKLVSMWRTVYSKDCGLLHDIYHPISERTLLGNFMSITQCIGGEKTHQYISMRSSTIPQCLNKVAVGREIFRILSVIYGAIDNHLVTLKETYDKIVRDIHQDIEKFTVDPDASKLQNMILDKVKDTFEYGVGYYAAHAGSKATGNIVESRTYVSVAEEKDVN
jgi:hypothetical protein